METQKHSNLIVEKYAQTFNFSWYRYRYQDAPKEIKEAFAQFRKLVFSDGRNPNPFFQSGFYIENNKDFDFSEKDPYLHFLGSKLNNFKSPHPLIDVKYILNDFPELDYGYQLIEYLISGNIDFTCEWFSRSYYKSMNPDLNGLVDYENHFLSHGVREDRKPSPLYTAQLQNENEKIDSKRPSGSKIFEIEWDGNRIAVNKSLVSKKVLFDIIEQGSLDPAVFAPGVYSIPSVNIFDYDDLDTRDLIDFNGLMSEVDLNPDVVILIPRLGVGGGEKYAAQMARVLSNNLNKKVVTIVTDSEDDETNIDFKNHILSNYRGQRVLSFEKFVSKSWKKENILALYLQALKPNTIFIFNSYVGMRMASNYGRFITNFSSLNIGFFSESPYALGAPYAATSLDDVITNCNIISDNENVLNHLKNRTSEIFNSKFKCLPQYIDYAPKDLYNEYMKNSGKFHLLWVGRWDYFKNYEYLVHLVKIANVEIDIYCPDNLPPESFIKGLNFKGSLSNFSDLTTKYNGFLFTSKFEGMPNIVLEMALSGLPIFAPKVGGLHETFSNNELFWYENNDNFMLGAKNILGVLNEFANLSTKEIIHKIDGAKKAVLNRHGKNLFVNNLKNLLVEVAK
jgi:glycosyltransferase involved in cell wall biosynthesis